MGKHDPEVTIPGRGKQYMSPNRSDGIHYYPPGPVSKAFLNDKSFISGIRGPFGSGKSTAVVMKRIKAAYAQKRAQDGWIYRRTACIRNTYPELRTTTMKTWHMWVPKHIGKWKEAGPPTHHIIDPVNKFNWEVMFVALDRPDDIAKLLGAELSDAWVNEAREVPKAVIEGLTGRVGRYPPKWMVECTDPQIDMDTNPPDSDSWWYTLSERDVSTEKKRRMVESMDEAQEELVRAGILQPGQKIMTFHTQPSGRGPNAENLANLPAGYYQLLMAGKDEDFIKVYVDGEYGFVMDGLPMYPEYRDSFHSGMEFGVVPGIGLRIGMDFGLTPACTISQRLADGSWLVHDEVVSERLGIARFAQEVLRLLNERYPGVKIVSSRGDPSGDTMTPEESTCFKIMTANGLPTEEAPTNDPVRRREGLAFLLRTVIDGKPAIRIHPRVTTLRKGLSGGFHRRRIQVGGEARYSDQPLKNKYSHVCEGLEYDIVSAGEDRNVTVIPEHRRRSRPQYAMSEYNVFGS